MLTARNKAYNQGYKWYRNKALGARIVIKRSEALEDLKMVQCSASAKEKPQEATEVLAVGPGTEDEKMLKVGDKVHILESTAVQSSSMVAKIISS